MPTFAPQDTRTQWRHWVAREHFGLTYWRRDDKENLIQVRMESDVDTADEFVCIDRSTGQLSVPLKGLDIDLIRPDCSCSSLESFVLRDIRRPFS
jgi:hypothetical protein